MTSDVHYMKETKAKNPSNLQHSTGLWEEASALILWRYWVLSAVCLHLSVILPLLITSARPYSI